MTVTYIFLLLNNSFFKCYLASSIMVISVWCVVVLCGYILVCFCRYHYVLFSLKLWLYIYAFLGSVGCLSPFILCLLKYP